MLAAAVYGTYGRFRSGDIQGMYPLPFTIYMASQQMWFAYGLFTNNPYLVGESITG